MADLILTTQEYNRLSTITNGFTGNYVSGYSYINSVIAGRSGGGLDQQSIYWYRNAEAINGNNPYNPANLFIRTATVAGLTISDLPRDATALQATSDAIAQGVLRTIQQTGQLPPARVLVADDIQLALTTGGVTIGGWGGSFYYWNASFRSPENGQMVRIGDYIQSRPAELEKFLAVNAQAILAAASTGLHDPMAPVGNLVQTFLNVGRDINALSNAELPTQ